MNSVFRQNLQSGITRMWVQRAHGNPTNEQFAYFVRGANYALRFFDLEYSTKEKKLLDSSSSFNSDILTNISGEKDPKNIAYFQRGYIQIKECADKAGVVVPEMDAELEKIRSL